MRDFWKGIALTRMAAVLAPGGTLRLRDLVFSVDLPEAEDRLAHWLDSASAECVEAPWTWQELEIHLRDEFSTFTWLLEPLFRQTGFEIEAADYGAIGAHADYICVKRVTGESGDRATSSVRVFGTQLGKAECAVAEATR